MAFSHLSDTMSVLTQDFPDYEELKQHYSEEIESLEQRLDLYSNKDDFERIFSDSEIAEAVNDIENLGFQEMVDEYGQSLVFDIIDYGLASHDLDNIQKTVEGEDYLEILGDAGMENSDTVEAPEPEEYSAEISEYSRMWTPKSEIKESFERYEKDIETIRNVFEGNDTPEEQIRWDELPETPEDFPEDPEWFAVRSSKKTQGPDWITVLD